MMRAGANTLNNKLEKVNALNVFPVPDGDTGTNMSLTITSGVNEMEKVLNARTVGELAQALAKGLLMGARGNSGVILSQLFRGFAKAVADKESINTHQLADAFQQGVETAYKAVIKPVEGTILTVAREAAEAGMKRSLTTHDAREVMETVLAEARKSLSRTPELLPVLKQANVVDAGGQGLVYIYEGILAALSGEGSEPIDVESTLSETKSIADMAHDNAQSKIDPSEIKYGYCTEFMIDLTTSRRETEPFNEEDFRKELGQYGDSILVVADEELVKVHIHAEYPGNALNYAMKFGDLTRIKIENMREQYANVTDGSPSSAKTGVVVPTEKKKYGIVAVASGKGIADIFRSMGVDEVIEGGQTMNPSTEDLVRAVERLHAEHVLILPNNKNIILTAEQVEEVVDQPVSVLPTRSIPQGLTALLNFNSEVSPEENIKNMTEGFQEVKSGEVTKAIRDSKMNGHQIKEGNFLGILGGKIDIVGENLEKTALTLLDKMIDEGADIVTIIYGEEIQEQQAKELVQSLESQYPGIEIEVHYGGQPVYHYLFAVE
ncbi:DAK2 domain-containing protein [Thermoactinomyces sp. AMNI-1]|uniref:DAK2 domain-containing protein n=2 Tax=Thermoactinomyces mirandus TaxID=2756294 RepID=A0A7W2AS79_9BACL|nr:DAK2 domain-containing protein [Thermoactinomyces mirandus]